MILTLPYPPSTNRYWRHPNKGKLAGRHLISEEGRRYRHNVWVKVMNERKGTIVGPVRMTIVLTAPDKRRRDLDNVLKALLDALTHAKVIEDDSKIWDLEIRWFRSGNELIVDPPGQVEVRIWPVVITV